MLVSGLQTAYLSVHNHESRYSPNKCPLVSRSSICLYLSVSTTYLTIHPSIHPSILSLLFFWRTQDAGPWCKGDHSEEAKWETLKLPTSPGQDVKSKPLSHRGTGRGVELRALIKDVKWEQAHLSCGQSDRTYVRFCRHHVSVATAQLCTPEMHKPHEGWAHTEH